MIEKTTKSEAIEPPAMPGSYVHRSVLKRASRSLGTTVTAERVAEAYGRWWFMTEGDLASRAGAIVADRDVSIASLQDASQMRVLAAVIADARTVADALRARRRAFAKGDVVRFAVRGLGAIEGYDPDARTYVVAVTRSADGTTHRHSIKRDDVLGLAARTATANLDDDAGDGDG